MNSSILVVGATGKTGRRLLPLLAGYNLRLASRSGAPGTVPFNWTDDSTHDAVLAGAGAVYLVPPDIADPTPLTVPFLERARRLGLRRVVLLSSLGVTFPDEPSGSGRRRIEQQVMDHIPEWTILRPSGFNQNFSEGFLLPGILQANTVLSATGDGKAGWVDAGDIAAVAAEALKGDSLVGEHLPITGPRALDFSEIASIISTAAEREIAYRSVDEESFRGILMSAGATPEYAEIPVRDQRAIRRGEGAMVANTIERVLSRPPISFEDFAKRNAAVWQPNLAPRP